MNHPIIVLIRPQMGENIGAVARAMANFGLSELRLVAPRDGWPNDAAIAMAANAAPIVHAATLYADVPSALADIHMAYATTARPRDVEKPVLTPCEAVSQMRNSSPSPLRGEGRDGGESFILTTPSLTLPPQGGGNSKSALVFGPERTGLTNDDLSWCHTIITIPTAENASLNIAQSAVVVLYEWFKNVSSRPTERSGEILRSLTYVRDDTATIADYQQFFTRLEALLEAAHFFKIPEKKPGMMNNIKAMFLRAQHTEQELRTLHGIVRALSDK